MRNLTQLFDAYQVRFGLTSIESSLVYPMDNKEFVFEGYVSPETLSDFFKQAANTVGNVFTPNHISNKYAIPVLEVSKLWETKTYFVYQHDSKTWLISLLIKTDKYQG
jgi:hypothetical protein